jgi:hypothetical protein
MVALSGIDVFRKLFETVVARCMKERLVGGEVFAVDASMIVADAHRRRGVAKVKDLDRRLDHKASRGVGDARSHWQYRLPKEVPRPPRFRPTSARP